MRRTRAAAIAVAALAALSSPALAAPGAVLVAGAYLLTKAIQR